MYLFIDTETGGITTDYSLLSITAIVTDKHFNVVPVVDYPNGIQLFIKSPKYVVNAQALAINNINIVSHDKSAVCVSDARQALLSYLQDALKLSNCHRFIMAGHNVVFDRIFIDKHLLIDGELEKYITYPFFDTAVIARLLTTLGLHDKGFSLAILMSKFCPEYPTGTLHDSYFDTMATIKLAKKFVEILGIPK